MSFPTTQPTMAPVIATPQRYTAAPATPSAAAAPTHAQIAARAFDIYQKTGCKQGQCKQNWQQAERSLHDQGQNTAHEPKHSPGTGFPHASGSR